MITYLRLFFLWIVLLAVPAAAQTRNLQKQVARCIELSLQKQPDSELELEITRSRPEHLLQALEHFRHDSLPAVRNEVYRLAHRCGIKAEAAADRQAVSLFLLNSIEGESSGPVSRLTRYLQEYSVDDYSAEGKYRLSRLARKELPYRDRLIKLSGFLQIEENIYAYKKELGEGEVPFRIKWAMNLAMARMGDADALDYIMQKTERLPVNDDLVYDLFPDLIYMRQPRAFRYMLEQVNSDAKDCRSANPSKETPILCAWRILAMVAPYIEDFPLQQDVAGGLDTDDYPQALLTAREWIAANADGLVLTTNTY